MESLSSDNVVANDFFSGSDKPFKYGLFHTKGYIRLELSSLFGDEYDTKFECMDLIDALVSLDDLTACNKARIEKYAIKDLKINNVLTWKSQRPLETMFLKDCLLIQDYSDISNEWKNSIGILGVSSCFLMKFDTETTKNDWLNVLKIQTHALSSKQSSLISKCLFGVEVKVIRQDMKFSNKSKLFVLEFELMVHDAKLKESMTSIPYNVINAFGNRNDHFIVRLGHRAKCGPVEMKFRCDSDSVARYLHSLVTKLMKERSRSHVVISEKRRKSVTKLYTAERSASMECGANVKKQAALMKHNGSLNLVRSFSNAYQSFVKRMYSDGSDNKTKVPSELPFEQGLNNDVNKSLHNEVSSRASDDDRSYVDPEEKCLDDSQLLYEDLYYDCMRDTGFDDKPLSHKHEKRINTACSLISSLMNNSSVAGALTDGKKSFSSCSDYDRKELGQPRLQETIGGCKQWLGDSCRSNSDTNENIYIEFEGKKSKHYSDCFSAHVTSIVNLFFDANLTGSTSVDYLTSNFEMLSPKRKGSVSSSIQKEGSENKDHKKPLENKEDENIVFDDSLEVKVSNTVPFDI